MGPFIWLMLVYQFALRHLVEFRSCHLIAEFQMRIHCIHFFAVVRLRLLCAPRAQRHQPERADTQALRLRRVAAAAALARARPAARLVRARVRARAGAPGGGGPRP